METKNQQISLESLLEIEADKILAVFQKIAELLEEMLNQGKLNTTVHGKGGKFEIENGKIKNLQYEFPEEPGKE